MVTALLYLLYFSLKIILFLPNVFAFIEQGVHSFVQSDGLFKQLKPPKTTSFIIGTPLESVHVTLPSYFFFIFFFFSYFTIDFKHFAVSLGSVSFTNFSISIFQ